MIPENRARECPEHAIEWDACQRSRCPLCIEREKRRELEKETEAAVQANHQLIRAIAPAVVALASEVENGG